MPNFISEKLSIASALLLCTYIFEVGYSHTIQFNTLAFFEIQDFLSYPLSSIARDFYLFFGLFFLLFALYSKYCAYIERDHFNVSDKTKKIRLLISAPLTIVFIFLVFYIDFSEFGLSAARLLFASFVSAIAFASTFGEFSLSFGKLRALHPSKIAAIMLVAFYLSGVTSGFLEKLGLNSNFDVQISVYGNLKETRDYLRKESNMNVGSTRNEQAIRILSRGAIVDQGRDRWDQKRYTFIPNKHILHYTSSSAYYAHPKKPKTDIFDYRSIAIEFPTQRPCYFKSCDAPKDFPLMKEVNLQFGL